MPDQRFGHGLIIGKFYPLHVGHSYLIQTALSRCESVTVQLLGATVESIPLDVRADWIRREHPGVTLVAAIDDAPVDFDSPSAWDEHTALIESLLDAPVDAVFTSDAYGEELARRLDAEWVRVDENRSVHPVSGRGVRADVAGNWHMLPVSVRQTLAQRVVVVGAESTGTTTLSRALASRYETEWVAEYGREWSERRPGGLDAPWESVEFDGIVDHQIAAEQEAAARARTPLIVCDTDVLATVLWHERYVGFVPDRLVSRADQHPPLIYILTGDEIPFVQDGMRDGEHIRHRMQERFRNELASRNVPWIEVTGSIPTRLDVATTAIDAALASAFVFADPLELADRLSS
jgi:HTH-type transcriptional regulator, transcriptional repressor of NAD biosynthesis genes